MQIGISTASLFPRYATEDALKKLPALGADCAEVFLSSFYEYRPEFSKSFAEEIKPFSVNSVHANSVNFEGNFFNPSRRVRGDGMYWLDQILRSAQLLGAKYYTFHGFHRTGGGGGEDLGAITGYLGEAAWFAQNYGVTLCLENVFWCLYNRPGIFKELKSRVSCLQGVLDVKQARRSHYPLKAYIKDMSGSIAYVHLSDIDEKGNMCLPGEGLYDFEEIFKMLIGEGFAGNAIIEVYDGDFKEESDLTRSVEYLKEIVYKIT